MDARRRHPVVCPLRTTEADRALIDQLAEEEGLSITAFLRAIVVPEVRRRARRRASPMVAASHQTSTRYGGDSALDLLTRKRNGMGHQQRGSRESSWADHA